MGNYKGMGDSKFIPNLPIEKLELFIKESEAYKNSPSEVDILWQMCKNTIYSLNENVKCLGFPGKVKQINIEEFIIWKKIRITYFYIFQGITTYFSSNYSTDDVECITNFMKQCNIEGYNNRAIKYESALDGKTHYQVRRENNKLIYAHVKKFYHSLNKIALQLAPLILVFSKFLGF